MLINNIVNKSALSALIISELRENYGIKYRKEKKPKPSQNRGSRKIFNIPLHQLELTDVILANGGITQVPLFVSDACQRILENVQTEGLFRKAGSAARQREIKANLEAGVRLGKSHHVIDVANILKSFFRELPVPILSPGNIQDSLLRCLMCSERKAQALMLTCLLLPPLSLNTLTFFMQFLNTVSLHSELNKMTVENLAIIFAPSLMPLNEIIGQRLNYHLKVIQLLIENSNDIGIVPKFILQKSNNLTATDAKSTAISSAIATPATAAVVASTVSETESKKKKKRRSGSLTRMFNGLRKIVGALGSNEDLNKTPEVQTTTNPMTPCISKSARKRKVFEGNAFSSKKIKDILTLMPDDAESILPSTPACHQQKETKKNRLSLGTGKRDKHAAVQPPMMERRWSVVGAGWNLNNSKKIKTSHELSAKQLSPVVVQMPTGPKSLKDEIEPLANAQNDYVRISKSEYEAIKDRVSAIETRISQEFVNVMKKTKSVESMMDTSMNACMNGPEKVLDKYEKTLEETEGMGCTSSADQLAKRLSRDLKIRRSLEHKVIRSPSARKIGTMRRRSRENVRLSRNQSWHLGNKRQSIFDNEPPPLNAEPIFLSKENIDVSPFHSKKNLKRGRPINTAHTKPRHRSPTNKSITDDESTLNNAICGTAEDLSEKWTSGEEFFADKIVPCTPQPSTPYYVTSIMLPPRMPVIRKTPSTNQKTPLHLSSAQRPHPPLTPINRTLLTQLQEHQTGRASIARLRSQNAGMVAAKAKLFDGYVCEGGETVAAATRRESNRFTTIIQMNQNSPSKQTTPRRRNGSSGVNRRQKIRLATKCPANKSPLQKMMLNQKNILSPINQNTATDQYFQIKEICSPQTKPLTSPQTPYIKRPMLMNSPRRLIKTPAVSSNRKAKMHSPMRATPLKLRNSPRLQLLHKRNAALFTTPN